MKNRILNATDDAVVTPISSLIDIVFLLIIFFVVTSAIEKEALDETIKLAETHFVSPISKNDPRTITVNIKKLDELRSEINIGKVPLSVGTLSNILKTTRNNYGSDVPVVIRASGDLQYSDIDRVISVITDAGLTRIRLSLRDVGDR